MDLILQYIESKQLSWAASTLAKEHSRLKAHAPLISRGPKEAYLTLQKSGMKPYSIKTTMIRLGEFELFAYKTIAFKEFMASNANLFKYAYQTERVEVTFEEATERIERIPDLHTRSAARQLLESGLRSCELATLKNERVIGKGGKPREVHLSPDLKTFKYKGTYWQLYAALRRVGLKPHTLRKLCASAFSRQDGVTLVDTMEEFGWSDMNSAKRYLQPMKSEQRGELLRKATGK
jgi:integrase